MVVWAKHAVVALAVTLLFSNARCFAICPPPHTPYPVSSESGKSSDCHYKAAVPVQSEQHSDRESRDTHDNSCLHDLLLTAVTDNHTIPVAFPTIEFSSSVVPYVLVLAGSIAGTDASPPSRSHPGLTIVIRV